MLINNKLFIMLSNNNLNLEEHKSDDPNGIEHGKSLWNNYNKDILIPIKTKFLDCKDKKLIKNITKSQINEIFCEYEKKWILQDFRKINLVSVVQIILMNFNIESVDEILRNDDDFKSKIVKNEKDLNHIMNILDELCINYDNDIKPENMISQEEYDDYTNRYQKINEIMWYYRRAIDLFSYSISVSDPQYDNSSNEDMSLSKYKSIKTVEIEGKDHQILLNILLDYCQKKKYSKYKGLIYKPVYTKDNYHTLSCRKVMEIDQFVHQQCSRNLNPKNWDLATKDKSTIGWLQGHLNDCVDSSIPTLIKDRYLFSFSNGIYKLFIETPEDGFVDKFYPYSEPERPELNTGMVSNKYFDQEFSTEEIEDWYDIQTDNIQKILDLQYENNKECEEICRWMYILMGRLLYKIGELDEWQVICFMKGLAGTGKGTITKTVQKFYDVEDVGVLGNDSEKTFGLSAIYDKLLFIAPEIKADISLSQASFQSMISGEDVNVAIKHKTAVSVTWEVPGILAGNEVPNWTDNSGSIARRLIIFAFNKKVPRSQLDPQLWNKIKLNIPNILRKCNLAYLDAVNKYASKNIWDILPNYFRIKQQEISEQTNELKKFLKSQTVVYGKNYYISERELNENFQAFLKINRKHYNYSIDKLNEPFQTLAEEYKTEIKLTNIDRRKIKFRRIENDNFLDKKGSWIRGMTIQDPITNEIREDKDFVAYLKFVDTL